MNILIIKTGGLGDVVRTSFIAQALWDKHQNKNPNIFWITDALALPLFKNNPFVHKVVSKENKESLRHENFDIVINLEEDEDNCKFASSLKYKHIIGFIYEKGRIIPTETTKYLYDMSMLGKKPTNDILKKKNKKSYRQIIAEIVGINNWRKYEPFLRLTNNQRKFAGNFLRRHNLSRRDLIIGINTGAADRWPKAISIEKTAKLIDNLSRQFDARLLLFGGSNEIERNRQIIAKSRSHIIDAGCGNDLIEFPALISACSLIITSDTLGLHVALALKRKTICLIGPTSPSEADMYGFGEKVVAKSSCVGCYKKDCKSIEKVDMSEIIPKAKKLLRQKITLLITAFKEPNIGKAIESALNKKTKYKYDILVSAPDKETISIAKKYAKKNKRIKIFKDPGKGKMHAINVILSSLDTDILILTDGDVCISKNAIEEISNRFLDPEIGCLTGRPVPIEDKSTKYGYWANFLFEAAHKLRKSAFESNSFIECSGYLFAFRKKMIHNIPIDTAEDSIIPYFFWEKGYKIGYTEKAEVYVKNVNNWKDWISQKTRTSKAHEALDKYVNTKITPRVKTFGTESKGIGFLLSYPKTIKEFLWTFELAIARLYMWAKVFYRLRLKKDTKVDNWKRVESAR